MAEILCLQCLGNCGEMVERCCENPLYLNKGECCCMGVFEFEPCDLCGGSGVIKSTETPTAPAQTASVRDEA